MGIISTTPRNTNALDLAGSSISPEAARIAKALRTKAGGDPKKLKALTRAALKTIRTHIPPETALDRQLNFLKEFKIQVTDNGRISVTPDTTSKYQFLKRAQKIAFETYGKNPISPELLARWSRMKRFTKASPEGFKIAVVRNMAAAKAPGKPHTADFRLTVSETALLHAACVVATGKGLFPSGLFRTLNGGVSFSEDGLRTCSFAGRSRLPVELLKLLRQVRKRQRPTA